MKKLHFFGSWFWKMQEGKNYGFFEFVKYGQFKTSILDSPSDEIEKFSKLHLCYDSKNLAEMHIPI